MYCNINLFSVICSKVCIIASIHLVLILYGLVLTIEDIINLQNPFNWYELINVACYYIFHFLLIFLLFAGSKRARSYFYLPWLVVLLAIFSIATYYWLESVFRGSYVFVVPTITNIVVLGLVWLSWFAVFKEYMYVHRKSKSSS